MNLNIFEQNFRGRDFMAENEKVQNFRNIQENFRPNFVGIFPSGHRGLRKTSNHRWKSSNILDDHFGVKIAILSSNLNDFDQPDMSNRFKGAEGQFRCINRTLLRMRVSISKFSIFKIFIFPLREIV
jgi:hypothetical protein